MAWEKDTSSLSTQASVNIIDLYHDVPSADSSDNAQMRDVIGNKTDTRAGGDSLYAKILQIEHETGEIETHLHSYERWFEIAASPSGETHVADAVGTVSAGGSFTLDAGNNTWGSWVQILGSSDTPFIAGKTHYDLHRIEVESTERTQTYFFQVAFGDSGAAGLAADDYSTTIFTPTSNQIDSGPIVIQDERKVAGTKAWARCMCAGQNTGTMEFFFGIHEYDS